MRHAQDDLADAEAGASARGAAGGAAGAPAPERAAGGAPEHAGDAPGSSGAGGKGGDPGGGRGDSGSGGAPAGEGGEGYPAAQEGYDPTEGMNMRQRKLWELQQKLAASRRANQDAVVAEKRRKVRWLHSVPSASVRYDVVWRSLLDCCLTVPRASHDLAWAHEECSVKGAKLHRRSAACRVVWVEEFACELPVMCQHEYGAEAWL